LYTLPGKTITEGDFDVSINDKEWWQAMFDTDWIKIFAYKNRDTRRESIALRSLLGLPDGSKILDVACGDGRISIALARLGYQVTGLDASKSLLESAQKKAKRAGLGIEWILGDIREIGISEQFEAAVSIFTSFGYFQNDSDNLKALKSISRALKTGGRLILDLENIFLIARAAQINGGEAIYRPIDNYRGWVEEITRLNTLDQRVEMSLRLWLPDKGMVKTGGQLPGFHSDRNTAIIGRGWSGNSRRIRGF
jgi:ubiquinone/menaquinone biosynthesis C-methylase UbiE